MPCILRELMRRSWLFWATGIAVFALTIIIAIAGNNYGPAQGNQSNSRLSYTLKGTPTAINPTINGQPSPSDSSFGFENSRLFAQSASSYRPVERLALAHPSNYGERVAVDINGNPETHTNLIVLHETVGSAGSALNTFRTNHPNDNDQVSYHTLIGLDGTIYYVVPPEQRAFGAGNSSFKAATGEESTFTNPDFPSSVNNFAYHISLEPPPDGNNNNTYHSGYTEAQDQSLAWLIARSTVPNDRITTQQAVDRSGSRMDPRSCEPDRLLRLLSQYPSRQGF
mgnify:CR=1 FL=1